MEHTVEDIRKILERVWLSDSPSEGLTVDEGVAQLKTLFSTLLDGLVMEERKPQKTEGAVGTTPSGHHVTMDFTAFGGKRWETGDHWEGQTVLTEEDEIYNRIVRELNAKISTIQRALKGETE